MRAHDDVGTLTGWSGDLRLVADLVEGQLLDGDLDAVRVPELVRERLQSAQAGVVRPDHQIGVGPGDGLGASPVGSAAASVPAAVVSAVAASVAGSV